MWTLKALGNKRPFWASGDWTKLWMALWIQAHSMHRIRTFSVSDLSTPVSVYCPVSESFLHLSCHLDTIHADNIASNLSNCVLYCRAVLIVWEYQLCRKLCDLEQCADLRWENYYSCRSYIRKNVLQFLYISVSFSPLQHVQVTPG